MTLTKMRTIFAQLGAAVCVRVCIRACVRVRVCAQTGARLRPNGNNLHQNTRFVTTQKRIIFLAARTKSLTSDLGQPMK